MVRAISVADFLSHAIELSGKTQREIAREVGYDKPNVLSMMKQGITKVPIDKIPALAESTGVDTNAFLRTALREYMPNAYLVISQNLGDLLSQEEKMIVETFRENRDQLPDQLTPKYVTDALLQGFEVAEV